MAEVGSYRVRLKTVFLPYFCATVYTPTASLQESEHSLKLWKYSSLGDSLFHQQKQRLWYTIPTGWIFFVYMPIRLFSSVR